MSRRSRSQILLLPCTILLKQREQNITATPFSFSTSSFRDIRETTRFFFRSKNHFSIPSTVGCCRIYVCRFSAPGCCSMQLQRTPRVSGKVCRRTMVFVGRYAVGMPRSHKKALCEFEKCIVPLPTWTSAGRFRRSGTFFFFLFAFRHDRRAGLCCLETHLSAHRAPVPASR